VTTVIQLNPLTELYNLAPGRYVIKDASGNVDYLATSKALREYIVTATTEADYETFLSMRMFFLDLTYTDFVNIFSIVKDLEALSSSSATPTPPRTDIISGKFSAADLAAMTWKRQFFEIAVFTYTDQGTTGITEKQYKTYGLDYYVRTKFIEEQRVS